MHQKPWSLNIFKSKIYGLICLWLLAASLYAVAGEKPSLEKPLGDNCQWLETTYTRTAYPICVFTERQAGAEEFLTIFYTPIFLMVEKPGDFGVYATLKKNSSGSVQKNILEIYFLLEDDQVKADILAALEPSGQTILRRITPGRLVIEANIPGTDRWVESLPYNIGNTLGSYGTLTKAIFELNEEDTQKIVENLTYGEVQFRVQFGYISKVPDNRGGSFLSRYVFPEELLEEIFQGNERAELTQWQVYQLWSRASLEIRKKLYIEERSELDRYLSLYLDWAAELEKTARRSHAPFSLEFLGNTKDVQLESAATALNIDLAKMKREHDLVMKSLKDPSSLSASEKTHLENIPLFWVSEAELTKLSTSFLDLTEFKESVSSFTTYRSSKLDRVQVDKDILDANANYERFPYVRHWQPILSGRAKTADGAIEILTSGENYFSVKSLEGNQTLSIPLAPGEMPVKYAESIEEDCLMVYVEDRLHAANSVFCVLKEPLALKFQIMRLSWHEENLLVIVRPDNVKIERELSPASAVTQYANRGDDDYIRLFMGEEKENKMNILDNAGRMHALFF